MSSVASPASIRSFAILLVVVLAALGEVPASFWIRVTLMGLVSAGATGAFVRSVIWRETRRTPLETLVAGGVAGFVVGLAYLIPQWIGAPGVLDPSNGVVAPSDKIQFASALLVALSAGVGFETIFDRLRHDAATVPVAPASGPASPRQ